MKQKGFTLIELVLVIVLLGILAATAMPKFFDLAGDARAAVIKGVEGSVNSAIDMAHAKALIDGKSAGGTIAFSGETITLVNGGWPTAADMVKLLSLDADIVSVVDTNTVTFSHSGASGGSNLQSAPTEPATCQVVYDLTSAAVNVRPLVTVSTEGC
ncbi:type II secretion system protein [Thalassotalea aquiviva]|uniref:type II secretion system protein n=1 Tax=Thalassotalea aquiviva TaxID=3242415 RepID=UPI00352B360C